MKLLTSNTVINNEDAGYDSSRRRFLQISGVIAGAGVLLSGGPLKAGTADHSLGKGDIALLNFLYILQQIEADFYAEAVTQQKGNLNNAELAALMSVKNQEATHVKTLKKMLGSKALPSVPTDFSSVAFSDRASVLKHAANIEDMVVSGFNGAAGLFNDSDHALELSKMVIAEAGHSAYFRSKLSADSFGDAITDGLGHAQLPATVLALAEAYTRVQFDKTNLPNHTNS